MRITREAAEEVLDAMCPPEATIDDIAAAMRVLKSLGWQVSLCLPETLEEVLSKEAP